MNRGRRFLTGLALTILFVVPVWLLRSTGITPPEILPQDPKAKGPLAAPIQITEFARFSCSSCQAIQPDINRLLETYPGKIRLSFRHFAAEGQHGFLAHVAAEAAAAQGKFWPYHDRLFKERKGWNALPESALKLLLIAYAQDLGLDIAKFQQALDDRQIRDRVHAERLNAKALGIRGTPSFLIQNRLVAGEAAFRREADPIVRELLEKP